jgi:hypothetical protein
LAAAFGVSTISASNAWEASGLSERADLTGEAKIHKMAGAGF